MALLPWRSLEADRLIQLNITGEEIAWPIGIANITNQTGRTTFESRAVTPIVSNIENGRNGDFK